MSNLTDPASSNKIARLLRIWKAEPTIGPNFTLFHALPAKEAQWLPFPAEMLDSIQLALRSMGISALYSHQTEAWNLAESGKNFVVVTSTASGKTLCYNLPIISRILSDDFARALYIFPTKALAQDQFTGLTRWNDHLPPDDRFPCGIYDGDTPTSSRQAIRKNSRIILTNPDMLHTGILPHHTSWVEFFRGLRYIVIDEIHTYRGVFGSHIANLIRRLKRIAHFYGADPQFIFTSATIANPRSLAEGLSEELVEVIDQDGAPSGERLFAIYNPPVINPDLGLRAGVLQESTRLMNDLLAYKIQTLQFVRTRRAVEWMLKFLQFGLSGEPNSVQGYRSGYLPLERRAIEQDMRSGKTLGVVATNALELGIDIGSISVVIISGYPGTIASTRQQAGRAGRKQDAALAIFIASGDPLDQFLVNHPEYLLERSPEQALIDTDNLLILLQHIRCAAFELPFSDGEKFGALDQPLLQDILGLLASSNQLHKNGKKYFWMADQYPSSQVSLRSSSSETIVLQVEEQEKLITIGEIDYESALWMVHPQAVYLHAGQSYLVESLDLVNQLARMSVYTGDYYTQPRKETTVEMLQLLESDKMTGYQKSFGDIKVTTKVIGYRKVRWYTNENLGEGELTLPPTELVTNGYWLTISDEIVESLRDQGHWTNDPNDYGSQWDRIRMLVRQRDKFTCQVCGVQETGKSHHVHHKIPFRAFLSAQEANRLDNITTLCPQCHKRAEANLRIRSGLAGLSYVLHHLAPLFLMCDINDLGAYAEAQSPLSEGHPVVAVYDLVPAGIGLSKKLYEIENHVLVEARQLIMQCGCPDGCPSCVGPGGENGMGGKQETMAILDALSPHPLVE
jgi:DEAD/DEAH box helicase domain-containing protein